MKLPLLVALLGVVALGRAQTLSLSRTIALEGVRGRIDHFALDAAGQRLFVAALGNNTVEVIDLAAGKVSRSLAGFDEPQGLGFAPEVNRLYVANGGDGTLRVLNGTTFAPVTAMPLGDDADNVRYEPATKTIFVGYGSGALALVDAASNTLIGQIALAAHPESFQLEPGGDRVFINVPDARTIAVVSRRARKVVAQWPLSAAAANFPLALDVAHRRVFIGCRRPAQLLVYAMDSGAPVATVPLHGDCDDLFYDAAHARLFASCGAGYVDVIAQADADHYARREAVATAAGARTSFLAGSVLYVAVPDRGGGARIQVYSVAP